ncbi:MAG: hypothetical protein EVA65_15720 [Oceanococcus sp.]|nr:MAG: hypothetical protein EVA65_15720 [Oceanococcus sp.]
MAFSVVQATDSGPGGYHLSVVGSPALVASDFSGFGNKVTFPDATDSRLRRTDSSPFILSALSEFTIEAKLPATAASGNRDICGVWGTGGNRWIFLRTSGTITFVWSDATNTTRTLEANSVVTTDEDVAVDFDGTTVRLLAGGSVVDSVTGAAASFTASSYVGADFFIGQRNGDTARAAVDGVDEVRISSVSRYGGAYTPSATPFTSDANTVALYHFDSLNSAAGGFVEQLPPGTTSWTVPSVATHGFDVTSVDIQCYGAGGNGGGSGILNSGGGAGGGGFAQLNNHPVTPGEVIPVQVAAAAQPNNTHTFFRSSSLVRAAKGFHGEGTSGLGGAGDGGAGGTNNLGDVTFNGGNGNAGSVLGTQGQGGGGAGESGPGANGNAGGLGGPSDGGRGGTQGLGGRDSGFPGGGGAGGGQGGKGGQILLRYTRRFKTFGDACAVLSAEMARDIDRTNAVSSLALDASLARTIERTGQATEQLDADLVRKLISRQSAATEGVDTSVQRMTSREAAVAAEFDAETLRSVSRQGEAAEELACALVRKVIARRGAAAEQLDAELVRKQIGRTGTATEALDADTKRTVDRAGVATEALDGEVHARSIERYGQATELLDAELRRVFEKYGAAIEDLLGDINARTISRNAEPAIAKLAVEIRRVFERSGVATEELDVTYELVRRQADFDTFTQLRAILLQHGHEWLNQHFGPLLLRILQTINIDGESSEDHE